MTSEEILMLSEENFDFAVEARRHLHRFPELGNMEFSTTEYIIEKLTEFGIEVSRPLETGCVGFLQGKEDGCIALRADIDALPVTEETGLDYASENKGIMHACGHDIHTATLLTVAKILAENRDRLTRSVKFIFQPDEEGYGGAKRLIDAGAFENPTVTEVFGMHIRPEIESGKIAVKYGKSYAASDMFTITVHGKSSHGAEPQNGANALLAASAIVSEINKFAPRGIDPETEAVASVCTFNSGTAGNIIPDKAEISGILRTLGQQDRLATREKLKSTLPVAEDFGCKAELNLIESYPGVVNHEKATAKVEKTARELLGECIVLEKPTYTTEDFGYYLFEAEGSFFHIGVGSEYPLHNCRMNPDERAMKNAVAVYVGIVFQN